MDLRILKSASPYIWLARYYDRLVNFRAPMAAARRRILGPVWPEIQSACDLGCGTGITAMEMARRGLTTCAVDLSPDMCRIARRKFRLAGLKIAVIQADMRSFELPLPVDLIVCESDAINHAPRRADLARIFRQVFKALQPGGYFYFDLNNKKAFELVWSRTWFLEADGVALVMQGSHKAGTLRAAVDLDWFIRRGERWARHREHVEEICWSAREVRDALRSAGFGSIRGWDATRFFDDALTLPGCRTFWLARRPLADSRSARTAKPVR